MSATLPFSALEDNGLGDSNSSLRLNSHHTLTLLFNHKILLAPIGSDPKKALDIGCGTGEAS